MRTVLKEVHWCFLLFLLVHSMWLHFLSPQRSCRPVSGGRLHDRNSINVFNEPILKSPTERLNSQSLPGSQKKELPLQGNVAHLIHWTLFCCRPTGPGDQAVQDGGGLLVFWAQGTEGQHGEGFTHHGFKERWGQSRPTRSAAKRGFSSRGGRKITKLSRSSASPLLFFLLLLPSCACSFLPSSTSPLLFGFASRPHVILLLLLSPPSRPLSLRKSSPHHQPLPHPPQRGKKSWWKHVNTNLMSEYSNITHVWTQKLKSCVSLMGC